MITLLSGQSLTKAARFQAESMPLNLAERSSTASLVIGPEVPEIAVGSWLLDEDEPGAGIVWRVKSQDNQVDTETRTLQLEHMINSLRDRLMFGEITPAMMSGTTGATTCTAQEAVEYILSQQSDWVLGGFDYTSVSNPYSFNGDDLFSALETVSSSLADCWWSYDFSSYPFTLNITHRASTVGTELRMSRNIQNARITIDKSRMFTRLYPIGKNNLHIDGNYVSRNEEIYGIISKTETDQSKATKAELLRWADELIANHCEPAVTVTVGLLDLSAETGESLDHVVLGAMCRMPLPGYNTVIQEIITRISYPDKLKEPDRATATMANTRDDVASIINNLIRSGGRGGRAGAKQSEEDHAWFVDTTDHVAMIAEGVAGEGASQDWSRVAELLVDGNGIHQRVQEAQQDIVTAYSLIDQTTTAIRLEIGTVASEVRSFIEQTPDMIHAEVGYAVSGFAHSVIEQTATYIRSEVSNAASAITQSVIEQTTEYVQTTVSAVASGVAWSVVTQTMTNIQQEVARKSKVYIQPTDPNDGVNVLREGDVWVKSEPKKTWNQLAATTWDEAETRQWKSYYGDMVYVWRSGAWVLVKDTSVDVDNFTRIDQNDEQINLIARAVDAAGNTFNSNLEVTARQIRSSVSTAQSKLYSTILQTDTNIRMQVANEIEGLQSSIEVTDQKITTSVSAAKSALYSTIVQTATSIRTEVKNAVSGLQSSIQQTAESITTSVSAAKSSLYSTIMQTATSINLSVKNAVSGLQAQINVTDSKIDTSVSAAKSNLYSVIVQTSTSIFTKVMNKVSGEYSTITQTSTSIALAVNSAKSSLQSSIQVQADRISLVVSGTGSNAAIKPASIVTAINNGGSSVIISATHINLEGYVKATDITSDYINGKIAGIESVGVKNLAASGSISIKSGNTYYAIERSIKDLNISLSGNTYTLQKKLWGDSGWTDVGTFSRATSLSGVWSGRNFQVSASPQGNVKVGTVYDGIVILSNSPEYRESGGHHYIKQYVRVYSADENGDADKTIMDKGLEFNADLAYEAGVADAPDPHPNSLTIARTKAGRSSGGSDIYYGRLYYWDADAEEYEYAGAAGYWYRSATNLGSGSHTVYY